MSVKDSINAAFEGNLHEMQQGLKSELNSRAVTALDEKKIQIAKNSLKSKE